MLTVTLKRNRYENRMLMGYRYHLLDNPSARNGLLHET